MHCLWPANESSRWQTLATPTAPGHSQFVAAGCFRAPTASARGSPRTVMPRPTLLQAIAMSSRTTILSFLSKTAFSVPARSAASGAGTAAACVVLPIARTALIVALKSVGGRTVDAAVPSWHAVSTAESARPRRASLLRNSSRPRSNRPRTVASGQCSSLAASSRVLPSR